MQYLSSECRKPENFIRCAQNQMSTHYNYFSGEVEYSTELAISKNGRYAKYKDSKILIVGGGPSANDYTWDPTLYNFVFSCNHFYLYDKLKGVPIDFAPLSPEVDVFSREFLNYLDSSDTLFCFENVDIQSNKVKFLLDRGRACIASLRLNLKVGTTIRLLIIASYFQPSEIHVIGMDGVTKEGETKGKNSHHSFQPGKPMAKTRPYETFYKEYGMIWNYLINGIGRNIRYKNLGHGHPYNVSTEFNII